MEWNLKDLYESIDSKKIKNDFNKLEKNSLSFAMTILFNEKRKIIKNIILFMLMI